MSNRSPHFREGWIVLLLLLLATAGRAAEDGEMLRCGATVTGRLAAGEVREFTFEARPGDVLALEAVDVSRAGELLQVRIEGPGLRVSTCTGRIEPSSDPRQVEPLEGGTYTVRISDCFRDSPVEFAVTLDLVSDSNRHCGRFLRCGDAIEGALLAPGEVDALRIAARRGDVLELRMDDALGTRGGLEVRVFDPDGVAVEREAGSPCLAGRRIRVEKTGVHTLLLNACLGFGTGAYRVRWIGDECPAIPLRGVHTGDGSINVMVATDQAAVERFVVAGAACGLDSFPDFALIQDTAIEGDRFAVTGMPVVEADENTRLRFDVDGVFEDIDDDGVYDQALGGFSVVGEEGRCNFQWSATSLADEDGDGWGDPVEVAAGSTVSDPGSVPESIDIPTTRLFGPGVCRDFVDNDGDAQVDGDEGACRGTPQLPMDPSPRVYAGRHADGGGVWLEIDPARAAIVQIGIAGLPCVDAATTLSLTPSGEASLDGRQRFRVRIDATDTDSFDGLTVAGALLDADGDGVGEQATGRIEVVRKEGEVCAVRWSATGILDSDGDGWSDAAERRLGSDPLPLPLGRGGDSVPENALLADVAEELGGDVCNDGIDNDGDGAVDGEDAPDCPAAPQVTETPIPTPTSTPIVATCGGDCGGDGEVTVDEILALVALSLGGDVPACPSGDTDASGTITVDEIVAAVNHAIAGC